MLSIFFKELFNSSIFSREETLRIKSRNTRTDRAGNKVMKERLLEIKNK